MSNALIRRSSYAQPSIRYVPIHVSRIFCAILDSRSQLTLRGNGREGAKGRHGISVCDSDRANGGAQLVEERYLLQRLREKRMAAVEKKQARTAPLWAPKARDDQIGRVPISVHGNQETESVWQEKEDKGK